MKFPNFAHFGTNGFCPHTLDGIIVKIYPDQQENTFRFSCRFRYRICSNESCQEMYVGLKRKCEKCGSVVMKGTQRTSELQAPQQEQVDLKIENFEQHPKFSKF